MINAQELQGQWNQIRGQVKQKWGQLTDDDLQIHGGNIDQLVGKRRIRALLPSEVETILPDEVVLTVSGAPEVVRNDFVIVNIGGDLPVEFLARSGISLKKHFGEELAKPRGRVVAMGRRGIAREDPETEGRRRGHRMYLATGALILAWLAVKGWSYYPLTRIERLHSPLHAALRPAGSWGTIHVYCAPSPSAKPSLLKRSSELGS